MKQILFLLTTLMFINLVQGQVRAGNSVTSISTTTLTNKTISGGSNTLSNIAQSSVTNLTTDLSGKLASSSNLSDVGNATTSRNNILPSKTGNSLKYLRVNAGETDYEVATVAGGGDVSKVGTPVNNQVGVWTGDGTLEGASSLTYDGANFQLTGDIGSTGSRITKGWFTDLQVTNSINGSVTGSSGSVGNSLSIGAEFIAGGATTYNGSAAKTLALQNTGVSATSYVNGNFTVDATGRLSAASNGYSAISPAQITGDQDNWAPTGWDDATTVRLSGDATIRAITSLTAPTQIYKPQRKTLINIGTSTVYFPAEHPDGTAANRIANTEDYLLFPGKAMTLDYDITSSRWRILDAGNTITNYTVHYDWSAGSVTSGDFGGMTFLTVGTGTNTATASTTSLPASMLYSTAASATAGFMGYFSKSVVTYSAFATGHNFAEAIVSIPTLSTGTETFFAYLQLTATPSSTTAEVNNSCGIRYNEAVNGGRWQLYTQDNAGAESTADLGVTVATGTLYKLRIEIDKAKTEVRAYVNDAFAGRVTGNMPNSVVMGSRTMLIKTVGTTARTMNVHRQSAGAIHN